MLNNLKIENVKLLEIVKYVRQFEIAILYLIIKKH